MGYRISLTESAKGDIAHFSKRNQRIIVVGILSHLKSGAEASTRKRKPLRPNPVAPWELRIDPFRVFYAVEGNQVKVVAVGHKENNRLFIRGTEVEL